MMNSSQMLVCAEYRKDNKWHHVAVTWSCDTGKTEVFFDGIFHVPTWRTSEGHWQSKAAKDGGVDPHMAPQTLRLGNGKISFTQQQICMCKWLRHAITHRELPAWSVTHAWRLSQTGTRIANMSRLKIDCPVYCALVACTHIPFLWCSKRICHRSQGTVLSMASRKFTTRHQTGHAQGILFTKP